MIVLSWIKELIEDNAKNKKAVHDALDRFANDDWGDMCAADKELNEEEKKFYAMGSYKFNDEKTFWIVFNDGTTTVLLPEEY